MCIYVTYTHNCVYKIHIYLYEVHVSSLCEGTHTHLTLEQLGSPWRWLPSHWKPYRTTVSSPHTQIPSLGADP